MASEGERGVGSYYRPFLPGTQEEGTLPLPRHIPQTARGDQLFGTLAVGVHSK